MYDQEIQPHEKRIVWYHLRDQLPDVSPARGRPGRSAQGAREVRPDGGRGRTGRSHAAAADDLDAGGRGPGAKAVAAAERAGGGAAEVGSPVYASAGSRSGCDAGHAADAAAARRCLRLRFRARRRNRGRLLHKRRRRSAAHEITEAPAAPMPNSRAGEPCFGFAGMDCRHARRRRARRRRVPDAPTTAVLPFLDGAGSRRREQSQAGAALERAGVSGSCRAYEPREVPEAPVAAIPIPASAPGLAAASTRRWRGRGVRRQRRRHRRTPRRHASPTRPRFRRRRRLQ